MKTMRSTLIPAVALTALLALAGCSGDSTTANVDACTQFAVAHDRLAELTAAGPVDGDVEQWTADKNDVVGQIESLTGQATGDVQASLETLVDGLPADTLELTEADSISGQAFVDNSTSVVSACESDGTAITLAEFPLQKFN